MIKKDNERVTITISKSQIFKLRALQAYSGLIRGNDSTASNLSRQVAQMVELGVNSFKKSLYCSIEPAIPGKDYDFVYKAKIGFKNVSRYNSLEVEGEVVVPFDKGTDILQKMEEADPNWLDKVL